MYFGISEKRQRLVYLYPNEPAVYDLARRGAKPSALETVWIEGAETLAACDEHIAVFAQPRLCQRALGQRFQ
jgi:hypothetical protein